MWDLFKWVDGAMEQLDTFDEPQDCLGEDLSDLMMENDYIGNIDDYDVDGDNEYIAVMGKTEDLGEFCLVWRE